MRPPWSPAWIYASPRSPLRTYTPHLVAGLDLRVPLVAGLDLHDSFMAAGLSLRATLMVAGLDLPAPFVATPDLRAPLVAG